MTAVFSKVFVKPRRRSRQTYAAAFEFCRLSMQAQDLARSGRRCVRLHTVYSFGLKVLNELSSRGFVLDEDNIGTMEAGLLLHSSLEIVVVEALSENA